MNPVRFSLILALGSLIAGPQAETGTVEGRIRRTDNRQPIPYVRLLLRGGAEGGEAQTFSAEADSNGRFRITNVPVGFYIATPDSGGIAPGQPRKSVAARLDSPGQTVSVVLSLEPVSAISGRTLEPDGTPAANLTVVARMLRYGTDARRDWGRTSRAVTDENGEYRIPGLVPGSYFLHTSAGSRDLIPGSSASVTPMTFYPGVATAGAAAAVPVRIGYDQQADFSIVRGEAYTVSGTVTSVFPGMERLPEITLSLAREYPSAPAPFGPVPVLKLTGDGDGTFELRGVPPGTYELLAQWKVPREELYPPEFLAYLDELRERPLDEFYSSDVAEGLREFERDGGVAARPLRESDYGAALPTPGGQGSLVNRAAFVVREDVVDLQVILRPGVEVSGRLTLEDASGPLVYETGGRNPWGGTWRGDGLTVRMMMMDPLDGAPTGGMLNAADAESFAYRNVSEGLYALSPDVSGGYIADIRQGGRSLSDDSLRVGTVDPQPLEIVLRLDGGELWARLDGLANHEEAFVVLVPEPSRRSVGRLYRSRVVAGEDASRILFRDVAPGNYKLFAWEAAPGSESVPYTDPAFLAAYETQGIPVDVEAGLRRTDLIRVPLIRRW